MPRGSLTLAVLLAVPWNALAAWRFHTCEDKASLKDRYVRWYPAFPWTNITANDTVLCDKIKTTLRSDTFSGIVDEITGGYGYEITPSGLVEENNPTKKACLLSIQKDLGIKVTVGLGGSECYPQSAPCPTLMIASNVTGFIESATSAVVSDGWSGLATDFEAKYDYVDQRSKREVALNVSAWYEGLSEALEKKGASAGVSRWAGCVHNGLGDYMNMTCAEFAHLAPKVHLLAMGTYWDNSPDGFENLLLDAIISTSNTAHNRWNDWQHYLSPALCPSGCNDNYKPTQSELYDRMNLACALGITDISVFDFQNVINMVSAGNLTYPNALRYFRTGVRHDVASSLIV